MSEKRNWDQDFPKTPESFKLALKQQVEKEMANENDRSEDIKKNGGNKSIKYKKEKKKMGEDCCGSSCFDWTYEWWCLCGNKIRCISACWS